MHMGVNKGFQEIKEDDTRAKVGGDIGAVKAGMVRE